MPFGPGSTDLGAEFVHGSSTLLSQLAAENSWQLRRLAVWAQGDGGPPAKEAPDGGAAYYVVRDKGGGMRAVRFSDLEAPEALTIPAVREAQAAHRVLQDALLEMAPSDSRPLGQAMLDLGCNHRAVAHGGGSLFGAGYANTACLLADELSARMCATTERAWEKDEDGGEDGHGGADFRLEGGYAVLLRWLVEQLRASGVEIRPGCVVDEVDATGAASAGASLPAVAAPLAAPAAASALTGPDPLPGEAPAMWGRLGGRRGVTLRGRARASPADAIRVEATDTEAAAALLDRPPRCGPTVPMLRACDLSVVTVPPDVFAGPEDDFAAPGGSGGGAHSAPRLRILPPLAPMQAACASSVQCEPAIKVVCRFRGPAWPDDAHGAVFESPPKPAPLPGGGAPPVLEPWFPEIWFSTDRGIGARVAARALGAGTPDARARCVFEPAADGTAPERGAVAVAVGFATGDAARALMRCGQSHLVASLAAQLAECFGSDAPSLLLGGTVGRWERAYTSPSLAEGRADGAVRAALHEAGWSGPPGGSAARRVMQTPHAGGAVLFAGEACAGADEALDSPMTVHGAMMTGRRAATAALAALSADPELPVPLRVLPSAGILRALSERRARL